MKKTVQDYMSEGLERPYAEYFAAGRRNFPPLSACLTQWDMS